MSTHFTEKVALDHAAQGIRINAVCPGMVRTPVAVFVTKNYDPEIMRRMVAREPIGRFGEAEEIAAAVIRILVIRLLGEAMLASASVSEEVVSAEADGAVSMRR